MAKMVLIFDGLVDGNGKPQISNIDKVTYDDSGTVTLYYTSGVTWRFDKVPLSVINSVRKAYFSLLDSEDGFKNGDWDTFVAAALFGSYTGGDTLTLIKGGTKEKKILEGLKNLAKKNNGKT